MGSVHLQSNLSSNEPACFTEILVDLMRDDFICLCEETLRNTVFLPFNYFLQLFLFFSIFTKDAPRNPCCCRFSAPLTGATLRYPRSTAAIFKHRICQRAFNKKGDYFYSRCFTLVCVRYVFDDSYTTSQSVTGDQVVFCFSVAGCTGREAS